jgi:hypothetical protein
MDIIYSGNFHTLEARHRWGDGNEIQNMGPSIPLIKSPYAVKKSPFPQ